MIFIFPTNPDTTQLRVRNTETNMDLIRYAEEGQQIGILNTLRRWNEFFLPISLFDLATLDCLCQIANIPRFKRVVNDYFLKHFRGKGVWLIGNNRRIDNYATYFEGAIQQVRICGMNENTFSCVAANFPFLTKITFEDKLYQNFNVPIERADILLSTMRMVETVAFTVHQFKGPIFDRLLYHANNIRILIINSTTTKPNLHDSFEVDESRWYSQFYPKLCAVQWDDGIVSNPLGFQRLLSNNPNIQHLIFTRNIQTVMDFVEASNLQLHRLDIKILPKDLPEIKPILRRLKQLSQNRHFKQLHITCNNREIFGLHLNTIRALKGITYNGDYIPAIGEIMQLTDLMVDSIKDELHTHAAIQLNMLRNLYINRASIDVITPFICKAPQMMKIVIKNTEFESLRVPNFHILAQQRGKLPNVQRLKIYLEERVYCVLKRYETEYSKKWFIILRIDELLN